ncbi:calcium-binding protein [Synechococcus sp. RSCCF101]|uniref:calcium-binding protein n=1 Tax=Synechococcus sp. RSCCF101 TaxID=2511069 RepID=UPI001247E6B5|nr:calcium-binding protein [Synechococcus sp. RSCCF101]QEY32657.1 calcium-binding protein [Synechococcus sp. RSCCF101]
MTTAASQINTFLLADDGVVNFSDLADSIDLEAFPDLLGQPIRLLSGNDRVTGADVNVAGYANRVNGNLGSDDLFGSVFRDFYRGGKEEDELFLRAEADFGNGNNGDDDVYGEAGNDLIRGGRGDDELYGGEGSDILIGDFGQDELVGGGGADRFVIRTDSRLVDGVTLSNLSANPGEVDEIEDFDVASGDRIVMPGVSSRDQLTIAAFEDDSAIISVDFVSGSLFAAVVDDVNAADLQSVAGSAILIGATADSFLSQTNPDAFLANPDLFAAIG